MSATCARVTRSLPCGNPNASRTDERPVQLTRTDGHVTRTDGHVDNPVREPLSEELVQRVVDVFNAALPDSLIGSASQRRLPLSSSAPTQEDLPQQELSLVVERRTKMKHDKRPKKKPRG